MSQSDFRSPTDQRVSPALSGALDRASWQSQLDALLVREKAHTHEGLAIAAARRRLPMVEVDAMVTVAGPHGPVTLLDVFEGRPQLCVYFHMWHAGMPAEQQCEGCTFFNGQAGWPQPFATNGDQLRIDGRPTSQWSRLAKGRSDRLVP